MVTKHRTFVNHLHTHLSNISANSSKSPSGLGVLVISFRPSVRLTVHPSVRPSVCPSVRPSVRPTVSAGSPLPPLPITHRPSHIGILCAC